MHLYFSKDVNKRYYKLPTSNEVAIFMSNNRMKAEEMKDIVVNRKEVHCNKFIKKILKIHKKIKTWK